MAIARPKRHTKPRDIDIDKVIEGGGKPPESSSQPRKPIKFQMVIEADLCDRIDTARRESGTSRRAWLLQAALEKLDRMER